MKIHIILIFLFFFWGGAGYAKRNKVIKEFPVVNEVILYDYFVKGGTTFSGMLHRAHDARNQEKIVIDDDDVKMLNEILKDATGHKLCKFQKTGIYHLYFDFLCADDQTHIIVLVYDSCFMDLVNGNCYHVSDSVHKEWIRTFQEKCRKEKLEWKFK